VRECPPTHAESPPHPNAKADFKTACGQYSAKDMRPFSSLEGVGMKKLSQNAIDIGAAHALSGAVNVNVEDLLPDPTT